jgi:hypothetical protein
MRLTVAIWGLYDPRPTAAGPHAKPTDVAAGVPDRRGVGHHEHAGGLRVVDGRGRRHRRHEGAWNGPLEPAVERLAC